MVLRAAAWFAETPAPSPSPAPPRYIDPSVVGPGVIGFVLFIFLGVATFLLWRSMNHQLKKIDFDEDEDQGERGGGDADAAGGETPERSDPTGTGVSDRTNRSETPEAVGSDRFGERDQAGPADPAGPTGQAGREAK